MTCKKEHSFSVRRKYRSGSARSYGPVRDWTKAASKQAAI